MAHTPDMLTAAEAGQRLRRSPAFVRRLIKSGRLRAVRMTEPGHWLVYADSVCALLGIKPERQHSHAYYLKRDKDILAQMGPL